MSQAMNLNHKAQRALSQILETPERFFIQTLDRFQELENREIAKLKKEILGLQDVIYEKDLQIKSFENLKSYTPYNSAQEGKSDVHISSFDQMNFNCCNICMISSDYMEVRNCARCNIWLYCIGTIFFYF